MKRNFTFLKNANSISRIFVVSICVTVFSVIPKKVQAQEAITIPNVFTPNSDGVNDEFKVNLNGNTPYNFNMSIYTNWGTLIFSSGNSNISWDGRTTSGLRATEGTYFYVLNFNGKQYKGTLTLID